MSYILVVSVNEWVKAKVLFNKETD